VNRGEIEEEPGSLEERGIRQMWGNPKKRRETKVGRMVQWWETEAGRGVTELKRRRSAHLGIGNPAPFGRGR